MEINRGYNPADFRINEHDFADDIMTPEQYANLEEHKLPYRYELHSGDKTLVAFGPGHFADTEHPAFKTIAEDIENFQPDLVLVEGMDIINTMSDEKKKDFAAHLSNEDAIRSYGESVYLAKLAVEHDIEVKSPEPNVEEIDRYALENGATKEAIFVEDMATLIHQYHRLTQKPSFEEYIGPYLERFREERKWSDFDTSFDNFKELYKQFTGKDFDVSDTETVELLSDPIPWAGQPFNEVRQAAQLRNIFRDRHIVHSIQEALKTHNKIYIVYGATHVVVQEPALRKIMDAEKQ